LPNRLAARSRAECFDLARAAKHDYAGFQNGDECWAGSLRGKLMEREKSECSSPCSLKDSDSAVKDRDQRKICGGPNAWSLYDVRRLEENLVTDVDKNRVCPYKDLRVFVRGTAASATEVDINQTRNVHGLVLE